MPADPVQVDSRRYSVLLENDAVRVLRIRYGPREKSVMHWHPTHIAIGVTDSEVRMHFPDGTSQDVSLGAGEVFEAPAGEHLPENLTDESLEVIAVELKGRE